MGNFSGNHDARMLDDGTVTLHDNGTLYGRAPRAVRYQLDLVARKATMIEQIVAPDAAGSGCCGSARKLSSGNWVTDWGGNSNSDEFTSSGTLVFQISFPGIFAYRTFPVLPGRLSPTDLRNGMNLQYPR